MQQVTSFYLLPWRTAFQPSFAAGSRYAPSDCPSSSLAFTLIHNISSCRSVVGRWLPQLTTFPICYTPRQVSHQDKLGDDGAALLRRLYFYTAALPKAESYINPHDRFWDYLPLTGAQKSRKLMIVIVCTSISFLWLGCRETIWRAAGSDTGGSHPSPWDCLSQSRANKKRVRGKIPRKRIN